MDRSESGRSMDAKMEIRAGIIWLLLCSVAFGHISYDGIDPATTDTYGLGTTDLRWSDVFAVDVNVSGTLVADPPTLAVNLAGYTDRVGIGTVTPATTLEVVGDLTLPATGKAIFSGNVNIIGSTDTLSFRNTEPNERTVFRVMPNGTVGDPLAALEFFGTDFIADATNYERLRIYANATTYEISTHKGGTGTLRPLILYTAGNTNQLYLKTDGNVGIGTATPSATFNVEGDSIFNDLGADVDFRIEGASDPFLFFVNAGNDKIGISTDPNEQLEITGNFRLPVTTATTGIIYQAGSRLIHTYGDVDNFFSGQNAGNLTIASAADNTGVGRNALTALTTGDNNACVGAYAGLGITTASNCTAMGRGALLTNSTANLNTAFGAGALEFIIGASNTAIGYDALGSPGGTTAVSNTALGTSAGAGITTGDSNVFLGTYAGAQQTTNSNRLIIDNQDRGSAATEATDALIYGVFDTTVGNQTLSLNATTTVDGFILPVNPVDGYALISDANGVGTWQAVDALTTYFPDAIVVAEGTPTVDDVNLIIDYDDDPYIITEDGGATSIDVNIYFKGVEDLTKIVIREYYAGSPSHHILIQLRDWVGGDWEDYADFVGQSGYNMMTLLVYDPNDHIGTDANDGEVELRFQHVQNGIGSHVLNIDFTWLQAGDFTGATTNLDGYARYLFAFNDFNGTGDFYTTGVGTFEDVTATQNVILSTSQTPASANATGTEGTIAWDPNYIYVCVTTDTWKRAALATWGSEKVIYAGEDVIYAGEQVVYP